MIIEQNREYEAYKDENLYVYQTLKKHHFKLFLTIKSKKARSQYPKFPQASNYDFREQILRKATNILRGYLKLRDRECWYLGIHEAGLSKDGLCGSNSAHNHIAFTYNEDIPYEDLVIALERWSKYLSKEFGLDACFRLKGKEDGDIYVQSQQKMIDYMSKLEKGFEIDGIQYELFFKSPFMSQNSWKNAPPAKEEVHTVSLSEVPF